MAAPPDVDIAVIYLFRRTRNEERMRQGSYVAGSGSGWVVECGICEGIAVKGTDDGRTVQPAIATHIIATTPARRYDDSRDITTASLSTVPSRTR